MEDLSDAIWDRAAVKDLLRDPFLIQQHEARWRWIQERGGLQQVQASLRELPLPRSLARLLCALLDEPKQKVEMYAHTLNTSVATYYRWLDELTARVLIAFSTWDGDQQQHHASAEQLSAPAQAVLWQYPSVPVQTSLFIGRDEQVSWLQTLLQRPDVRLVTLTGPGGIGKTSLALRVVRALEHDFVHGALFVSLAAIRDPELFLGAMIQAVGLQNTGSEPALQRLCNHMRHRELLLVLDNFEQLITAAPLLGQLLASVPTLKLLVTSRTVLHLQGEKEFPVPPLALPRPMTQPLTHETLEELAGFEAVQLFVDRAQNADPGFRLQHENALAIAEICRRLDGLPLAIELAAACVKVLSPQALVSRLQHRLALLPRGTVDRPLHQQTLRGTLDWSYELLEVADRQLFRQLAVFSGGCTLESITAITQLEELDVLARLASLIDQSMIQREQHAGAEVRFSLLEIIREYGQELLTQHGELAPLKERHAAFYLTLAEAATPELSSGPRQKYWRDRLTQDYANIRDALDWALGAQAGDMGLRFGAALWKFWFLYDHVAEGRIWLARILEQTAHLQTPHRCKALYGAGWLAFVRGDQAGAVSLFEQALSSALALESLGDAGMALHGLGEVHLLKNDYEGARRCFEQSLSLFSDLGDDEERAWSLHHLGRLAKEEGDFNTALACYDQALPLFQHTGVRRGLLFTLLHMEELRTGHIGAHSYDLLTQLLSWFYEMSDRLGIAWSLLLKGIVALGQRQLVPARRFCEEALVVFRELEDQVGLATAHCYLGHTAFADVRFDEAASCYEASLVIHEQLGSKIPVAECLERLAALAIQQQRLTEAALLCGSAEALLQTTRARLQPLVHERYQQTRALIRTLMDQAAFDAAFNEGQTLSPAVAMRALLA